MLDEQGLLKAEKHIKNAWIAGIIVTILTLVFSAIGTYSQMVRFKYGLDTWSLFDVAVIAGLTFGIYKKKRFCALGLFIYYVFSKFLTAAGTGNFAGGLGVLVFGYFFFQGTSACFLLHKHLIKTEQITRKKKGPLFYAGLGISCVLIIIFVYLAIIGTYGPTTEVVPGKLLKKQYAEFAQEQNLIENNEEIIYWYSDAFSDFKNGFYFFTKKKVVMYSNDWEEPAFILPYFLIKEIKFDQNPSVFEDSRITIMLSDSSEVYFPVSSENDGDRKFYESLNKEWESKKPENSSRSQ